MSEVLTSKGRVTIEESFHSLYKELADGNDPMLSPFRTMKDVFMWAVSLGLKAGTRRPLTGKQVDIFHMAQLSSQIDVPLLKALAISETGDLTILTNQNEILRIAEEYANAGIYELKEALQNEGGQPLLNLIKLVQ